MGITNFPDIKYVLYGIKVIEAVMTLQTSVIQTNKDITDISPVRPDRPHGYQLIPRTDHSFLTAEPGLNGFVFAKMFFCPNPLNIKRGPFSFSLEPKKDYFR
jgi:hypothetical protein